MAIPSGGGSEVLKRHYIHANSDAWAVLINGVASHLYTVISVVANDQGNAAESINLRVVIDGSGQDIQLKQSQSLPANGTFVWNEKIVLQGTDHLEAYNSAGNVDWYVSYIDQDWS